MTTQTRLSAFKILNAVSRISLVESHEQRKLPTEFCALMAREKINILFLSCGSQDNNRGLDAAIDPRDAPRIMALVRENFATAIPSTGKIAILSLFPHRSDPSVTGSLFQVLDMTGIEPDAVATSNSAISLVVQETAMDTLTSALFEPFRFSAYRTPADWKLAQKGKDQLYKEVVASYQEKKPKVYSLSWQENQQLFRIKLEKCSMRSMASAFAGFSRKGLILSFLTSSPSRTRENLYVHLCAPEAEQHGAPDLIRKSLPETAITGISPVSVFSMNGPHFGDRYGIVGELLEALDHVQIDVLALGCAIASISGVVPSDQVERATRAIQGCFEVPAVIRSENNAG